MTTVYKFNSDLYGIFHLYGKGARLQYLETSRSRKWRNSSLSVKSLTEEMEKSGDLIKENNGWFAVRWIEN